MTIMISPDTSNHRASDVNITSVMSYEELAFALKLCYKGDEKDSPHVINILKRTITYQQKSTDLVKVSDIRPVQPIYPNDIYKYLLRMSLKEKFDLAGYCSSHPGTLWEYSRKFSVLGAVTDGDYERTLFLLQHGVDVIPEENIGMCPISLKDELKKMIRVMTGIKSKNQEKNSLMGTNHDIFQINMDQKRCFELMWSAIPTPYVRSSDLLQTPHLVTKYGKMYELNFKEIASSPKQPRSLMHLSRCVIRKRLKDNWKLPEGIHDLDLPVDLHKYLNLEYI